MTPDQFIMKWKATELKERSAAQSHFIDLCRMLDEPSPTAADPTGEWYCFERGATKTTGGEGWADVWKRNHFGWEYKGKRRDLNAAFVQLQQYPLALENPPLLVVCDMDRFRIHTNWTNTVSELHEFGTPGSEPESACRRSGEPTDRRRPKPRSRPTFDRSPMRESRTSGSVRGDRGNSVPYRYSLTGKSSGLSRRMPTQPS